MWKPALLGIFLVSTAAGGPTTREIASDWLDRAKRDIAALPAETPKDFSLIQPSELAVELYLTAPSDEQRSLAIQLIDRTKQVWIDKNHSAENVREENLAGALLHAQVGDLDGARKLLEIADKSIGVSRTLSAGLYENLGAETYLLMNDQLAFERVRLSSFGPGLIADDLRATGHPTEARRLEEWARTRATTQPSIAKDWAYSPSFDGVQAVRSMARAGDLLEAFKAAALVDEGNTDMPDYYGFQGYIIVARAALDAVNIDHYHFARTVAIDILKKHPDNNYFEIGDLLELCAKAKDVDGFNEAAAQVRARVDKDRRANRDRMSDFYAVAKLAKFSVAIGDMAAYRSNADEAEDDINGSAEDPSSSPDQMARDTRQKAIDYLIVAAAHARAGDFAGVKRDVDKSKGTASLGAVDWDEGWCSVVTSYADAGLFNQAISAMAETRDDPYGFMPSYIARREFEAGKFDDAWTLAAGVSPIERIKLEYFLTIHEIQTGRESKMPRHIEALKSPYERAFTELAVSQALLGRIYQGCFHEWLNRAD